MTPTMLLRPSPSRRPLFVVVMCAVLAACGTPPSAPEPTAEPRSTGTPRATGTAGPTAAATSTDGVAADPVAADPPPLALEEVGSGLADPISISAAANGWLLVNERGGRVIALDPSTGEAAVAGDLSDRVLGEGERGLLGLVLHPEWPAVGRAFVHYSGRDGGTVVAELAGDEDPSGAPILDAASERILLEVDQPFPNHNGGQLAIGPDGYLWIALGDGGSGGDPNGNGQDPTTLLGTILRLDVASPGSYAIPDDNPFASGESGAPEVYLWGLRNPWRFSFDRMTDELWIADVGQNAYEEINRLDPVADVGANLGWNVMEASHCFAVDDCSDEGLVMPIAEYGRELGCSVTGGYVYRGEALPDLRGWYLFGDYCTGYVFGVPSDAAPARGGLVEPRVLLESGTRLSSFGEGADGEIYLADIASGAVYRIVGGD